MVARDLSERERATAAIEASERRFRRLVEHGWDVILLMDAGGVTRYVTPSVERVLGYGATDVINRPIFEFIHPDDHALTTARLGQILATPEVRVPIELRVRHRDGTWRWIEATGVNLLDDPSVQAIVGTYRDITERKKTEDEKRRLIDKLEHLSKTDGLTGLINRRALTGSLTYEIDRAKRYQSELAIILCDVDNFKAINDTYGHDAGDQALQVLSATLKTILRKTDIAGRYGGDEFMLILPETSIKGAESLAEKLLSAVRDAELHVPNGRPIHLSMSIGIAGFELSREGENIDAFVKRADDAMYVSKQGGKDRVSIVKV